MSNYFKGKYTSWADLFLGFRLGEISKDDWALRIDNDHAALHYTGPCQDSADDDRRCEEGHNLFYYDAPVNPQDILAALNIPVVPA